LDDVFLTKYDSSGNFQRATTWGGSGSDAGYSVAVDNGGNAFVVGYFSNVVDFDPSPGIDNHSSNGQFDAFLVKLLPSGYW
jgi:hypothetical protein